MAMAMGASVGAFLANVMDAGEAETEFGRALLQVRYKALQRQIPLLYLIALANALGYHLGTGLTVETLTHPINLLLLLVAGRLVYWLRNRDRELAPEAILAELRKTLILSALFSTAGCLWAIQLLLGGAPQQEDLLILFTSLAAIGVSFGLSSFPTAARMPLLLFALPFSVTLALSPNPAHLGVGISLVLVTLLTLRLVNLQNKGFVALVRSRSQTEAERERARKAEIGALAEKARVKRIADTDHRAAGAIVAGQQQRAAGGAVEPLRIEPHAGRARLPGAPFGQPFAADHVQRQCIGGGCGVDQTGWQAHADSDS
mgnify:CR=1 FL=1